MSTSPHTRRGIHRPNAQRLSISLAPLVAQRSLLFRIQTDLANKASYSELSPLESSGLYTATASARLISAALSSASLPAHRRRRHRLKTPASSTPTSLKSSASVYSQDSGDDGGDVGDGDDGDEWEDEDEDNEDAGDSNAAISPLTLPTTSKTTNPTTTTTTTIPGVPSPASPGTPLHAQPTLNSKPRRRDAKKRITMSRFNQNRRHAVAFSPSVQLEDFCFSPFDDGRVVTTTTTTMTTESCSSASASASSSLNSGSGSETSVVSTPPDSPLAAPPAATTTTKPAVGSVNPMHTVDLDFYLQRKSQLQMGTNNPGAQSSSSSSSGLGMTIPGKGLVKIVSRLSSLSLIQNRRKSDMPPPSSRPSAFATSTRHARSNSTSSLPAIPSFSSSSSSVSFSSSSLDHGPVLSRPRALPTIPATPAAVSTSMDSDGMPVPVPTAPVNDNEQGTQEQPSQVQGQVRSQRSPSPELPTQQPQVPQAAQSQSQSHPWKSKRPMLSPPAPSTFTKGHRRHHSSPVPTTVRREWVQGGVGGGGGNGLGVSDASGKRTLPPVPRVPSEYIV